MTDSPRVIFEGDDFLVVHKPAGTVVYAVEKHTKEETLVSWLLQHYPEVCSVGDDPKVRPGIVHRLDRDTSGVMVVPRTQKSFLYFKSLFQKRQIQKTYLAVVFGIFKESKGVITTPIGGKSGTIRRTIHSRSRARDAVTEYLMLRALTDLPNQREGETFSLLKVLPKTGRTHQIRVHLASVHHPIVGDGFYGFRAQPNWAKRLMLHALSLEFTLASGERMKLEDEAPPEFHYSE